MKKNDDLLRWEYDAYKKRKRNGYAMTLAFFIALLTFICVLLLTGCNHSAPEQVAVPEEKPPVQIAVKSLEDLTPEEPAEEPEEPAEEEEPKEESPEPVAEPTEPEVPEVPAIDLTKLKSNLNTKLTHYCICKKCCGKNPDHPAYGITASGRKAEPYVSVAVDPALIPLGSTVYIDYGDGELHEFRADDTGGSVDGAHIDLCVTDHQEALNLGVKTVKVYWKEKGMQ